MAVMSSAGSEALLYVGNSPLDRYCPDYATRWFAFLGMWSKYLPQRIVFDPL